MYNVRCVFIYRGRQFIWDNLRMEDVSCYWETLLNEYASLLTWEPERDEKLEEIKPEKKPKTKTEL